VFRLIGLHVNNQSGSLPHLVFRHIEVTGNIRQRHYLTAGRNCAIRNVCLDGLKSNGQTIEDARQAIWGCRSRMRALS